MCDTPDMEISQTSPPSMTIEIRRGRPNDQTARVRVRDADLRLDRWDTVYLQFDQIVGVGYGVPGHGVENCAPRNGEVLGHVFVPAAITQITNDLIRPLAKVS